MTKNKLMTEEEAETRVMEHFGCTREEARFLISEAEAKGELKPVVYREIKEPHNTKKH